MEGNMEDQEDSDSEFEAINENQKDAEKKENLRMQRGNESGLVLWNVYWKEDGASVENRQPISLV